MAVNDDKEYDHRLGKQTDAEHDDHDGDPGDAGNRGGSGRTADAMNMSARFVPGHQYTQRHADQYAR